MKYRKRNNIINILAPIIILLLITGCAVRPPNIEVPRQQPPTLPIKQPVHVALALGGGGAKGFAHVGVLQALEEAGVPIDLIVGTSAGSIVGALYADNPNAKSIETLMVKTQASELLSDVSLFHNGSGFIQGNKMQNYLVDNMTAKYFRELRIPLIVTTTNFETGTSHPLNSGPIAPAVNASAAVPGAFQPVKLYGYTLVDGGVVENIPVMTAAKHRPQLIIAVDISSQLSAEIPRSSVDALFRAYDITLNRLSKEQVADHDVVYIHPVITDAKLFDPGDREKLIQAGYQATIEQMALIKSKIQAIKARFKK